MTDVEIRVKALELSIQSLKLLSQKGIDSFFDTMKQAGDIPTQAALVIKHSERFENYLMLKKTQ